MTVYEKHDSITLATVPLLIKTFSIYRNNAGLIVGYITWLLIPLVLKLLFTITFAEEIAVSLSLAADTALFIVTLWVCVVLTLLTPEFLKKKRLPLWQIHKHAYILLPTFALATLLYAAISMLGFFLLVVPGLLMAVWFFFAPTITVLERVSIRAAFARSKQLVAGRFAKILRIALMGEAILILLFLLVLLFIFLLFGLSQGINAGALFSTAPTLLEEILETLLTIALLPCLVIFKTLLYLAAQQKEL